MGLGPQCTWRPFRGLAWKPGRQGLPGAEGRRSLCAGGPSAPSSQPAESAGSQGRGPRAASRAGNPSAQRGRGQRACVGAAGHGAGACTLPSASAPRSELGARPQRVAPAGGGLSAHERAGRDVRRATPYVTGPCVVAAGLPSAAAPDEGGAAAGCGVRG